MDLCDCQGHVTAIIIPGPCKLFGILRSDEELVISYHCITKIGDDVILVDIQAKPNADVGGPYDPVLYFKWFFSMQNDRSRGCSMKCRYCTSTESKVIDSRPTDDGSAIRRRRECMGCGKRFTTYEKIEELPLMVVKRMAAGSPSTVKNTHRYPPRLQKRPISPPRRTSCGRRGGEVFNSLEQEIPSSRIGELVIQRLKELDEVAYVRFASVYRQFKVSTRT
jgi:transcriptional repressor NrdR